MRCRWILPFLALAMLGMSCEQDAVSLTTGPVGDTLVGSWLLVERGYSPGAGYFTDPVSPDPPQILTLNADYSMVSGIFPEYKYYRVLADTASGTDVLAFFRADPGNKTLRLSDLEHSYNVVKEEEKLKLWYRYCFEGCHLGFRRLVPGDSK